MTKRLTKTGNSLAVVLDKQLLQETGIGPETELEVSTDGDVIVISPVRNLKRTSKLREIMKDAHVRFGGAFRRLAE